MSEPHSSYVHALVILLVIATMPVAALAQDQSSTVNLQPASLGFHPAIPGFQPAQFSAPSDLFAVQPAGTSAPPDSENLLVAQAAPPPPAAPPPSQVNQVTTQIKRKARRWSVGGRIGVGFNPELFMFGLQSLMGPVFNPRFFFRPNVDFGFGELTDMFAVNLEGAYFLRTQLHNRWNPYFGMGPSLNFIHQGVSAEDTSFSDFSYKTGFNVFVGAQKNRTFVEMKTSLWSGKAPVLRLFVGYNF